MPDDGVGSSVMAWFQKDSISARIETIAHKDKKAISRDVAFLMIR
jgi:hypothetical protein